MSHLTKIFFGLNDKEKLLKSQNYERSFWDFEEDYVKLNEPINWEHGVFQYFSNNYDEFWSTLTGAFKKTKHENFIEIKNIVKEIYNPFTDNQISKEISRMLKDEDITADVDVVFQSIENLHKACPDHLGDWYFSGDYPTPGGNKIVNKAFMNYYEGLKVRAY